MSAQPTSAGPIEPTRPTGPTIDVHAHVFSERLEAVAGARYRPTYGAEPGRYGAVLDALGLDLGVLVQPSFLGQDNSYLLDALEHGRGRFLGIVVVGEQVPELPGPSELRRWDRLGVRGVRLNLIGKERPDLDSDPWRRAIGAFSELGWHLEVQASPAQWAELADAVGRVDVPVVIDHLGLPGAAADLDTVVVDLCRSSHVWVTASAPYRMPEGVAARMLGRLVDAGLTDRLLVGTDWPHTRHESVDTAGCLRTLADAVPAAVWEQALSANPARLYAPT